MKIFIRPAEGLTVPLPGGAVLPPEGAEVEVDQFIRRRLADGEVIEATPAAPASAPKASKSDADK